MGTDRLARRVLVVDDDPVNLMVVEHMLDGMPVPLDMASGSARAVELARELRPALILMDISMAGVSGLDAARTIRAEAGALCPRIVAVTANATPRLRMICEEEGFDGFLTKPLDMQELRETVVAMLDRA